MATDPFRLSYLTAATEPIAAVRRLAALTGAVQRETACLTEAQYLVTNVVPLLTAQITGAGAVTAAALRANIAGLNDGVTTATAGVGAANAALAAEQANQTALSAELATLQAGG